MVRFPGPQQYPFRRGDRIRVSNRSSVTTANKVFVRVRYEDGEKDRFEIDITHAGDRGNELSFTPDIFLRDGFIEALTVDTAIVARGECYLAIQVDNENEQLHYPIFAGYITPVHTPLGFFEHALGGRGDLSWRPIAEDIAPADVVEVLAAAGAYRRVYGFVWYYHCSSDVADRVLDTFVRAPGLGIPTGFSLAEVVNTPISALTLSADQEGIVYAYKGPAGGDGFASKNDSGSVVVASTDTLSQVWPLEVYEDDLVEIRFNETDAEAADRHSIYILQEEWIAP